MCSVPPPSVPPPSVPPPSVLPPSVPGPREGHGEAGGPWPSGPLLWPVASAGPEVRPPEVCPPEVCPGERRPSEVAGDFLPVWGEEPAGALRARAAGGGRGQRGDGGGLRRDGGRGARAWWVVPEVAPRAPLESVWSPVSGSSLACVRLLPSLPPSLRSSPSAPPRSPPTGVPACSLGCGGGVADWLAASAAPLPQLLPRRIRPSAGAGLCAPAIGSESARAAPLLPAGTPGPALPAANCLDPVLLLRRVRRSLSLPLAATGAPVASSAAPGRRVGWRGVAGASPS